MLFTTLSLSHSTDALYRVDSSHKGLLAAMIGQALSQELGYIAMSQTSKITTLDFTFLLWEGMEHTDSRHDGCCWRMVRDYFTSSFTPDSSLYLGCTLDASGPCVMVIYLLSSCSSYHSSSPPVVTSDPGFLSVPQYIHLHLLSAPPSLEDILPVDLLTWLLLLEWPVQSHFSD